MIDVDRKVPSSPDTPLRAREAPARDLGYQVLVVAGPDVGRHVALRGARVVVGTAGATELTLSDPAVSRRHLALELGAGVVVARDLGSTNGSFFLGSRFEALELAVGAHLTIGDTVLKLIATGADGEGPLWPEPRFGPLRGDSPAMRRLFWRLDAYARSNLPVLIEGESGTGKELIAQALHEASGRAGPYVIADLAGVPPQLIESELFGHRRGAFTGADAHREGAFARARGGTIFLDEIGELGASVQPRLLRVLETRMFKPLGSAGHEATDARVVAATNRTLAAEVETGGFRRDLYHRLAVGCVHVPPLRARAGDIPGLVADVIRQLIAADPDHRPLHVADDVLATLCAYPWPGNVRQLRNVLERGYALADETRILSRTSLGLDETMARQTAAADAAVEPEPVADDAIITPVDVDTPFKLAKDGLITAWEREYVIRLLQRHQGSVAAAARHAGIDRVHLHRLIRRHRLSR